MVPFSLRTLSVRYFSLWFVGRFPGSLILLSFCLAVLRDSYLIVLCFLITVPFPHDVSDTTYTPFLAVVY